jgi:hypothetical protein
MLGITRYKNTAIDTWQGEPELFFCEDKFTCPLKEPCLQSSQNKHLSFYFEQNFAEQITTTLEQIKKNIDNNQHPPRRCTVIVQKDSEYTMSQELISTVFN